MPRIAIFADIQNIYYTTREVYGRTFDYRRFWQQVGQEGEIVKATAYAISSQDTGQHKFQQALKYIGFEVKLKPFIQRSDGSAKGDWDVGITLDLYEQASSVDKVILLSGDGDFDQLLQRIKQRFGTETEVYGVPALTANSLIQSCDRFIEITPQHLV